jgi:RPA family protein
MSGDDQGGAGRREVAYRAFAAEYEDADFSYSESDEERAPNYVVLPTGARVNRLFVAGVLTEVEQASEEILRARIVDPTGAFVVYAGQYQPDALAFLERADPPAFVALTGKARTFQPEDSEVTYTSIRPETANEVDADTRDRWTVDAARQTVERVAAAARALTYEERGDELRDRLESGGLEAGLAAGIPLALDHYGTTATYLDAVRTTALDAAAVVAGERDEVERLDVRPDERGSVAPASLAAARTPAATDESPTTVADANGSQAVADSGAGEQPVADADDGRPVGAGEESPDADEPEPEPETVDADTDASPGESGLEDFEPDEFELDDEEREEIEREYGTDFQSGTEVDGPGEAGIDAPGPSAESEEDRDPSGSVATDAGATPSPTESEPAGSESADGAATGRSEPSTVGESGDADDPSSAVAGNTSADGEPPAVDASERTDPEAAGTGADPVPEADDPGSEPEPETAGGGDVDVEDAVVEAMRANDEGGGAARSDVVEAVVGQYGADESEVDEAIQDALMDGRCYEPEDDVYKPI